MDVSIDMIPLTESGQKRAIETKTLLSSSVVSNDSCSGAGFLWFVMQVAFFALQYAIITAADFKFNHLGGTVKILGLFTFLSFSIFVWVMIRYCAPIKHHLQPVTWNWLESFFIELIAWLVMATSQQIYNFYGSSDIHQKISFQTLMCLSLVLCCAIVYYCHVIHFTPDARYVNI